MFFCNHRKIKNKNYSAKNFSEKLIYSFGRWLKLINREICHLRKIFWINTKEYLFI